MKKDEKEKNGEEMEKDKGKEKRCKINKINAVTPTKLPK